MSENVKNETSAGDVAMPVVSVEYQHEETGRVGHVDLQQVEWGFFEHSPRLQFVCNLVRQADAQAALAAKDAEIARLTAERDALAASRKPTRRQIDDAISTWFAEDWAVKKAIGLLEDLGISRE